LGQVGRETVEIRKWDEEELEGESGTVQGPLLTIPEAARYLGVSRKTIYSLLESGRLTALKGRKSVKLVPRGSLDDFRSRGELT
jgi:excisionase family DNA binding protein